MQKEPSKTDLLVARHTARKVEDITKRAFGAFRTAAEEYGTLSPDELIGIGVSLFCAITVRPMERMSSNPKEMRRQLALQLGKMIKQDGDDVVN